MPFSCFLNVNCTNNHDESICKKIDTFDLTTNTCADINGFETQCNAVNSANGDNGLGCTY